MLITETHIQALHSADAAHASSVFIAFTPSIIDFFVAHFRFVVPFDDLNSKTTKSKKTVGKTGLGTKVAPFEFIIASQVQAKRVRKGSGDGFGRSAGDFRNEKGFGGF